jgi:sporulation protein YlmC with PRC-barrel domain
MKELIVMKMNQKLVMACAFGSLLTLPLAAQQQMDKNNNPQNQNPQSLPGASGKVSYTDLQKANKLIGMDVTDAQEHKLGTIKDFALNLQAGKIAEVIIGTGGFIGMDERLIAVPPQALAFANTDKNLRLADADTFRMAPVFNRSRWEESTSSASVTGVYQQFHAPAYTDTGMLERASKIIGKTARNQQHEDLGKVETIVVDLSSGRVAEVIVATGGFLGIRDELSAVPPQAFHYDADKGTLTLDTTRDALKNAPHFKPSDWRNSVSDEVSLSSVYKAYNVPAYFGPGSSDTTMQNSVPAADTAQSDSAITDRIQALIKNDQNLSSDAHLVVIKTANGRVTLQGNVDSEKEKNQVGDLAASIVAADHVNNQIEVIKTSASINK